MNWGSVIDFFLCRAPKCGILAKEKQFAALIAAENPSEIAENSDK